MVLLQHVSLSVIYLVTYVIYLCNLCRIYKETNKPQPITDEQNNQRIYKETNKPQPVTDEQDYHWELNCGIEPNNEWIL